MDEPGQTMKKVLITGASGFIGKALCQGLAPKHRVTGVYFRHRAPDFTRMGPARIEMKQADLTQPYSGLDLCQNVAPDVVIHCAALAHQKAGFVDKAAYFKLNNTTSRLMAF